MQDVDVVVVTCGGVTNWEDIPFQQVCLDRKKKVQFDVNIEKEILFEVPNVIRWNHGKLIVYEMPTNFYSTLEEVPLW